MRKVTTTHLQVKSVKNASSLATDAKGNVIEGDQAKHNTSSSMEVVLLPDNQNYDTENDFTAKLDNKLFIAKEFLSFKINSTAHLSVGASFKVVTVNTALSFSFKGFSSRYRAGDQVKITRISDTDYIVAKGMPITLFN